MRGDFGGHAHAARAGAIDGLQCDSGREVATVQRRARCVSQRDVALDNAEFGQRGLSAQAEPRGNDAVVHHAARREARVLAMLRERDVEIGQILEGAAGDAGVGDRVAVVADGDRAGVA